MTRIASAVGWTFEALSVVYGYAMLIVPAVILVAFAVYLLVTNL